MKFVVTVLAFVSLSLAAEARTVKVTGELARTLIDVSSAWGGSEGAAGHIYGSLIQINCLKIIDDTASVYEIRCSAKPPTGAAVVVSSHDQVNTESASQLRRILIQILGSDKKISPTKRQLVVKSMKCDAMTIGHEFDDIDLNPSATCTISQ